MSSRIPHVNCLKLFKGQMHQLISKCFVWQWMCQWFSEARAEKRAQRWWKAWLDLFMYWGPKHTVVSQNPGTLFFSWFNYQGSPCSTNFSAHRLNRCCHAAEHSSCQYVHGQSSSEESALAWRWERTLTTVKLDDWTARFCWLPEI
jgi:hypothetical protein